MRYALVDGGHRAIKYSRIGGVKKEIYGEGIERTNGRLESCSGN